MAIERTNVRWGAEGEDEEGFRVLLWNWRQDGRHGYERAYVKLVDLHDGRMAVYEKGPGYPLLPLTYIGNVSMRSIEKKRAKRPGYDPEDRILAQQVAQRVWNGEPGMSPYMQDIEHAERIAAANLAKREGR